MFSTVHKKSRRNNEIMLFIPRLFSDTRSRSCRLFSDKRRVKYLSLGTLFGNSLSLRETEFPPSLNSCTGSATNQATDFTVPQDLTSKHIYIYFFRCQINTRITDEQLQEHSIYTNRCSITSC